MSPKVWLSHTFSEKNRSEFEKSWARSRSRSRPGKCRRSAKFPSFYFSLHHQVNPRFSPLFLRSRRSSKIKHTHTIFSSSLENLFRRSYLRVNRNFLIFRRSKSFFFLIIRHVFLRFWILLKWRRSQEFQANHPREWASFSYQSSVSIWKLLVFGF